MSIDPGLFSLTGFAFPWSGQAVTVPGSGAQEVILAAAVVDELNDLARPWAGQFTAGRAWCPVYGPGDLGSLKVTVVPLTIDESERMGRGARGEYDYGLAVDFQQHVEAGDSDTPDAVCALAELVLDHFLHLTRALVGAPGWRVVSAKRHDVYSLEMLYEQGTFETLVVLGVKGARP